MLGVSYDFIGVSYAFVGFQCGDRVQLFGIADHVHHLGVCIVRPWSPRVFQIAL